MADPTPANPARDDRPLAPVVPSARASLPRMAPPPRREGVTAWLVMLLCLLAAAPAMLIDLYRPEVTDPDEALALATSIHTWKRINSSQSVGETFIQQLVPHYNGKSEWHRSPGVTWMHLLTFDLMATAPVQRLSATVTVGEAGEVAPPPPLEPVPAAGMTKKQLTEHLLARAEQRGDWRDVTVQVRAAPGEPARRPIAKAGEEDPPLAAGDQLTIGIGYVEANWRSKIDTIQLIKWGRLSSAALGMLLLMSVFWAGYAIAGLRAAALSALICAANPLFLWHARLAGPPMHQAAWAMLSIAAALWAIRPMRASPSIERQFLGWVISGLAFGATGLSMGPLVVVFVGGPVVLLLLLCPHRRGHLMGLLAAMLIGVLVTVPWTAVLHDHDPDAAGRWWREHQPFGRGTLAVFWNNLAPRIGQVILLFLPWTIWLIGAAAQPFSTSSAGVRVRLFLGWSWFALTLAVLLCLPRLEEVGGLLLLTPAWAVTIGLLFHQYTDMAAEGRFARFWRWLRWPHVAMLGVVSIVAPLLISWPRIFIDMGWLAAEVFHDPGWWYALLLLAALMSLTVWAGRRAYRQYPTSVAVITACWALLLAAGLIMPVTHEGSRWAHTFVRSDADQLVKLSGNCPIFMMRGDRSSVLNEEPLISLYTGREIRIIQPGEIAQIADKQKTEIFLLAPIDAATPVANAQFMRELKSVQLKVWRFALPEGSSAKQ